MNQPVAWGPWFQDPPSNLSLKKHTTPMEPMKQGKHKYLHQYRYFEKNTWTFFCFYFPLWDESPFGRNIFWATQFLQAAIHSTLAVYRRLLVVRFLNHWMFFLSMNLMTLCVFPKGMNTVDPIIERWMQQVCHQSIIRWDVVISINQCTVHMISVKFCFYAQHGKFGLVGFLLLRQKALKNLSTLYIVHGTKTFRNV